MATSKRRGAGAGSAGAGKAVSAKKVASGKGTSRKKAAAKKASVKKKTAGKKAAKKATKTKAAKTKKAAARKTARGRAATKKIAARKAAPKKKAAAKKTAARKATVRKATGTRKAATKKARPLGARGARRHWSEEPMAPAGVIPGLSEEDQIRSSKYLPRDMGEPLFEEERFLFPESYGLNRVRLLVRDPDWVFAYWDVSAETMKGLAQSLGKRAFDLSRLTLRVLDPVSGGSSDILLPPGARWWYIRTDATRRTYRAEIGITLPSGEFRRLAESNAVVTPRVGPSRERAQRRLSYAGAGAVPPEEAAAAGRADRETDLASRPWAGGDTDATAGGEGGGASESFRPARPGASDTARAGASDTMRPGASDTHRR
jgi:hypothetical protein